MNRIASVILFDVGCKKLSSSDDSFFARSKQCLYRLVLRKMFSEDTDEVGIILFGSESTGNCLADLDEDKYSNITELCSFGKPTFKTLELVESITQCKGYLSDWIRPIIVGLEYLRRGTQGKRYKMRQIVIFSEFTSNLDYRETIFSTISNCMQQDKVKLTVFGPDIDPESEDVSDSLRPLLKLFENLEDPLSISLDELAESLKYFEKKRKTKRVFNVDLEIGSNIQIPVGWVKLTSESQRFSNWVDKNLMERKPRSREDENDETVRESELPVLSENMEVEDDDSTRSVTSSVRNKEPIEDVFKVAKFGQTEVNFSLADLNALKRLSGPPSFKILSFTSKSQVNPTMYVGEDIFAVLPREKSEYSQVKLYSLIDAMIEKKKVAIARRIVMNNGKIQLGVLIPFSDECGKHMYFLKLPTSEWSQPFPRHRGYPKIDSPLRDKFHELVEAMKLPSDLVDDGKGVLVPDPHFQLRCQLFADRALNPTKDISVIPDYIKNIIDPCPENRKKTEIILSDIIKVLPSLNMEVRKEATRLRAIARNARKLAKVTASSSNAVQPKQEKHAPDVDSSSDLSPPFKHESVDLNDPVEESEDMLQLNSMINELVDDSFDRSILDTVE